MKNEELLDKVKTVLKEIEDAEHSEQLAILLVATKTLEVIMPDIYVG